jgi:serine/threonine protein kinase
MSSGKVGPWEIGRKLGSGGNAEVYEATGLADRHVALKLIYQRNATGESYRRFVREIEFLRSLDDTDGILPLLDAYLPPEPTKDRPWLAMPIAVPIRDALQERPLSEVVAGLASVAKTLARLHA